MKISHNFPMPIPLLPLLGLLMTACSSSSSTGSAETLFSDPIDEATLRSALITGSSSGDEAEYWECSERGGDGVFNYRLLADGSGMETDISNPTVNLAFTWEVASATSIVTHMESLGVQNDISNIHFTDKDTMTLVIAQSVTMDCERLGEQAVSPDVPITPSAESSVFYGGADFDFTHGFERVYDGYLANGRSHEHHKFYIADAVFRVIYNVQIGLAPGGISWYPNGARVGLSAHLYWPVDIEFDSATFSSVPNTTEEQNNPEFEGRYIFYDAVFRVDSDGDGSIDSDTEVFEVTGGNITVTRLAAGVTSMNFDVTLENGVAIRGGYSGQFVLYDE